MEAATTMAMRMRVGGHGLKIRNIDSTDDFVFSSKLHLKSLKISSSSLSSSSATTETYYEYEDEDKYSSTTRRSRRPHNVPGEFFVDNACIDCDTCRWMAPEVFTRVDHMSAVFKQPSCKEERLKSLQALLSCPTNSIHTEKPPSDILEVQKTFPRPVNEERIPGVFHCGYHAEKSYGATSYLIVHPQGNILVDSPRYTERLACNIEKLGGVRHIFLTHKDDIADHEKWSKRFTCDRIIHSKDVEPSTANVDNKLEGNGPWILNDDIELIHTPGHTAGSVCLLYKPLKVLFTGDHLVVEESELSIMERYNFCSVTMQLNSVKLLLDLDFDLILPGHRRIAEFKDVDDKNSSLKAFLAAQV